MTFRVVFPILASCRRKWILIELYVSFPDQSGCRLSLTWYHTGEFSEAGLSLPVLWCLRGDRRLARWKNHLDLLKYQGWFQPAVYWRLFKKKWFEKKMFR
jgi:hypothetical protein